MAISKEQKKKIVEELRKKIDKQKSMVFVDFSGIKVKDLQTLRKKMKKADCELKVAKKTLISLALKEKKIKIDLKKMAGEIGLGFGYKDEITPFKILYDFSKENEKLKILDGWVGGEFIGKERALELAHLPAKEELLAKLFFTARYPISAIFSSWQRNLSILLQLTKVTS